MTTLCKKPGCIQKLVSIKDSEFSWRTVAVFDSHYAALRDLKRRPLDDEIRVLLDVPEAQQLGHLTIDFQIE